MARPTLARRLGTATLLTALTLSVAACGSDDGSEASTGSDTSAAGEESAESGDEPSGDLEELDAAEFYPTVMGALKDAETFSFTTSTSSEGTDAGSMEIAGVMRYAEDGIDMQASGTGQGGDQLEMIMLDKVLYMSGVGMDLGDKKWLKIDMSDPNSLFGMIGKSSDPETDVQGHGGAPGVRAARHRGGRRRRDQPLPGRDGHRRLRQGDGHAGGARLVHARGHRGRDVGRRRQPAAPVPPGARDPGDRPAASPAPAPPRAPTATTAPT